MAATTVMVVEDTGVQRETLTKLLRREGYDAVGAADGHEAMRLLRQRGTPDLMLLDVNMPGIGGLELLEMIREDARWAALPVIVLTACTDPACVERAEQLGAKDYMLKTSFSVGEMLGRVPQHTQYLPQ